MENNNGKGIFYGVIGVATLVVAIIGATFAYFASATNGAAGAAAANSANVGEALKITEVKKYAAPDLIPASNAVMLASFAQPVPTDEKNPAKTDKCRGASAANKEGNYGMCSYYTFTIANNSDVATQVYLSLNTDTNSFAKRNVAEGNSIQDLEYCVFKGDETTPTAHACGAVPDTKEQFTTVSLASKANETYTVVLYLKNADADQTTTGSGKVYTGTVMASTSDGTNQIVGYIAGIEG